MEKQQNKEDFVERGAPSKGRMFTFFLGSVIAFSVGLLIYKQTHSLLAGVIIMLMLVFNIMVYRILEGLHYKMSYVEDVLLTLLHKIASNATRSDEDEE